MLRRLLQSRGETVQDLDLAADEKYSEGRKLMIAGCPGAGIYLMGYAAEMKLKVAYFLLRKIRPSSNVRVCLAPAKSHAATLIPGIRHETYHSLRFWGLLIRAERVRQRRPLDFATDHALLRAVNRTYLTWWVTMRYRPDQSAPSDAKQLLADVSWIRNNYTVLWR